MTTLRDIVTDAMRESGLVQIGVPIEAEQLDEGLRKLQTFILSLAGNEAGEPLVSASVGNPSGTNEFADLVNREDHYSSYFIPSNTRLMVNTAGTRTLYLDPSPDAGARISVIDVGGNFSTNVLTIHANGRKINGGSSVTLNTDYTNNTWFYRDDLGEWVLVTSLTANSESPFPQEFDEYLITSLAMRINPRYQQQTAPETLQEYKRVKSQFRARYRQTRFYPSEVFTLLNRGWSGLPSYVTFNKGYLVG